MRVIIIDASFPQLHFLDKAANKHLNALPEGQLPAALTGGGVCGHSFFQASKAEN